VTVADNQDIRVWTASAIAPEGGYFAIFNPSDVDHSWNWIGVDWAARMSEFRSTLDR